MLFVLYIKFDEKRTDNKLHTSSKTLMKIKSLAKQTSEAGDMKTYLF